MQAFYDTAFSREMGCTETEWLAWLPAALGEHVWQRTGSSVQVYVQTSQSVQAQLRIRWREATPRQIALLRIPRLLVDFEFFGLDDAQRYALMRRFDLYMQRGGG